MEWTVQSTLNLIRENLVDRYRSGFPVIQELVQNADDAKACQLDIGWTLGLPYAQHPLLQGPAIFVANDGVFEDRHAQAINSIALSSKSGEQTTIGKFGLGLKSIFHLCEAFFYVSYDRPSGVPRGAIVNPWANAQGTDGFHAGWDDFVEVDQQAVRDHLHLVLPEARYVCLWIPLRQERHYPGKQPIIRNNLGDELTFPEPLKNLDANLARLLPLLRCLEQAQGWTYDLQSGQLERTFRIHLGRGARRRKYPELTADQISLFGGAIEATRDHAETKRAYVFWGGELLSSDPILTRLKDSNLWPHSSSTDPETGEYKSYADKADQHAAVYFLRYPSGNDGGRLDIRNAVFLPVGEPVDSLSVPGRWTYQLVLHGYFFVDAGRSRLEGLVHLPNDDTPPDEASLRKMWNSRLARKSTFPLVLPALRHFVERAGLTYEEALCLTRQLEKSAFLAPFRSEICVRDQWLSHLTDGKFEWQLIPSSEQYFEIPEPNDSTAEALPGLTQLAANHRITTSTAPRLAPRAAEQWTLPMLLSALDTTGDALFGHRQRLLYANEFLQQCCLGIGNASRLSARLCQLAGEGFRRVELSKLRRYGADVARFLRFIPAELKLVFREKGAGWDAVLQRLLQLDVGVLLVPGGFEGDTAEADPAEASFVSEDDAVRLLGSLADLEPEMTGDKAQDSVRSEIARRVIQAARAGRQDILSRCGELPLFRGQGANELLSWNELRALNSRHTLFRSSPGKENQDLQRALPKERVIQLDKATADVLFGEGPALSSCNATSCIAALQSRPCLAIPEDRKPLLRLVQSESRQPGYRAAVRFLLHARGQDDDGLLYAVNPMDPASVWAKLLEKILARERGAWRVVPEQLASAVAHEHWSALGLAAADRDTVVAQLQASDLRWLDCSDLLSQERTTLFLEIADENLLRRLPIHEDLSGRLIPISEATCYLESPFLKLVPDGLLHGISIIRRDNDDRVVQGQERILPSFRAQAAIEIALKQNDPERYWRVIMDALNQIHSIEWLRLDQRQELRIRPWLFMRDGRTVAPQDVVYLPELEDEVSRLVASLDGVFADARALHPELQAHPGFAVLEREVFPKPDEALAALGMILGVDARYGAGNLDAEDRTQLLEAFLTCFQEAERDVMPAWSVLKAVADRFGAEKCRDHLLPGLLVDISAERLVRILEYLVGRHERMSARSRELYLKLHSLYLATAVRADDFVATILPKIRLRSRTGRWLGPHELCADVSGIDDSVVLDHAQWSALQGVLPRRREMVEIADAHLRADPTAVPPLWLRMLNESPRLLTGYFKDWEDVVDREIIGGFLSLLGDDPGIGKLAEGYLGNRHLSATRDLFEWRPMPGPNVEAQSVHQAMALHRFLVKIAKENTVAVQSLLGRELEAPLVRDSEMRNLLVGDVNSYFDLPKDPTQHIHRLVLRRVPAGTGEFQAVRLSDLLRETAREVLVKFYEQANPNVDQVWEELAQSEQLDIRIAQILLLESAFFYIKQLGVNADHRLGPILQAWSDAQRHQAEAEAAMAAGRIGKAAGSREQVQNALQGLRETIESDSRAQATILQAVRRKIEHFQYQPQSVPFELAQNADDAASELQSTVAGEGLITNLDRYVVAWDSQRMEFLHWGRPINEFRSGRLSDREGRELGYDHDLEKMLVLSYSDKQAGDAAGPSVTGRFGLGFKSVFTVCDEPLVLSGRLAFKVVGGMYPKKLDAGELRGMRERRQLFSPDERIAGRGTLIRLTADRQTVANNSVLARFTELVHIMLVFSRQIKHCDLAETGKPVVAVSWGETPVLGLEGVYTGVMHPAREGVSTKTRGLVLRCEDRTFDGALLLALDARGFAPLPTRVPTVWVTAPTGEDRGLGFALNGQFDLDVGRAQLARGSDRNEVLSREIGRRLGNRLVTLYTKGHGQEWGCLREALDLAADSTEYDLWASLWRIVGEPLSCSDLGDCDVVRRTLWGSQREPTGMGQLIASCAAIPSHLGGEHRCLTSWETAKRTVQGALEKEEVFAVVAEWLGFKSRHRPGNLVSYQRTFKVLDALWRDSWALTPLTLADAILDETGNDRYADPETAQRIGALVDSTLLAGLEREEQETLSSRLREICFRAQDGKSRPARELLIGSTDATEFDDREERARAAFAPAPRVLADAYTGTALQFLRACRGPLSAPAKELAEWALLADSERSRQAALAYLLLGQLSAAMAQELRLRLTGWLRGLSGLELDQTYGFHNPNDRSVILGRLGLVVTAESAPTLSAIDAHAELMRLYERWHAQKDEEIAKYEQLVYPGGRPPNLSGDFDSEDPRDRKEWLTLLFLGSFHTMGMVGPQQHRGFLQLMQRKGWFDVFARPRIVADEWIGVLDDYLKEQQDQQMYFQWVKQFVSIYQLARWLDDYREILLDLRHRKERFALDLVSNSQTSELYQGGGPSAPPLGKVLGIGINFVMRELVRKGIISSPAVSEHCYVPTHGVRMYLMSLGCPIDDSPKPNHSAVIYRFLVGQLGEERASFDGSFDLPLVMLHPEL